MRRCVECSSTLVEGSRFCPACGAPVSADALDSSNDAEPGPAINVAAIRDELARALAPRYEVRNLLGKGAMGLVFQARETELRRLVAVKVLSPQLAADTKSRQRFAREARAAAAVSNAFVVPVHGVGETSETGLPYIVMQFVNGPTLAAWMTDHPRPSEATARRIIGEIARALAAAHSRDLVHRDVKPGNVLIDEESGRALVADFGVAAVLPTSPDAATEQLTARGQIFGTYAYMSPEQISGGVPGPPSDVYSLGILAHELLAGEPPLDAPTPMAWAAAHLRDRPASLITRRPGLSPECAEILDRCLLKDPADRPTAREVADCLLAPMDAETPWPPAMLRGIPAAGRWLRVTASIAAVAGCVALATLAILPPSLDMSGEWWRKFADTRGVAGSVLGASVESAEARAPDVSLAIWAAALGTGTVAFLLAVLLGAGFAVRAGWIAARGRRLGWSIRMVTEALADADGRSGLILHGEREFAALPAERRRAVLGQRRLTTAGMCMAAAWVAAVIGVWSIALVAGVLRLDGIGPPAGILVLAVAAGPALLALGVALVAIAREARLLRPLAWRRRHIGLRGTDAGEGMPDAAAAPSGGTRTDATVSAEPGARSSGVFPSGVMRVGTIALALGVVAGALAFAVVVLAAGMNARLVTDLGPPTAALDAEIARASTASPVAAAESTWRHALPLSAQAVVPEDSVQLWLEQLAAVGGLPPFEKPPLALAGEEADGQRTLQGVSATLRRVMAAHIPPSATAAIARLERHPRTELLRRIARARDADLSPAFDEGRQPGAAGTARPIYAALREAAEANALVAALGAARGDRAGAIARLAENAAVAQRLLHVPTLFANQYGAGMLQDLAMIPLADLDASSGNAVRATELRAASARVREHVYPGFSSRALAGFAASPRSAERLHAIAADPHLAPGNRAGAPAAMLLGACFNVREVLGGAGPLRREAASGLASRLLESMPAARAMGTVGPSGLDLQPWPDAAERGEPARLPVVGRVLRCEALRR